MGVLSRAGLLPDRAGHLSSGSGVCFLLLVRLLPRLVLRLLPLSSSEASRTAYAIWPYWRSSCKPAEAFNLPSRTTTRHKSGYMSISKATWHHIASCQHPLTCLTPSHTFVQDKPLKATLCCGSLYLAVCQKLPALESWMPAGPEKYFAGAACAAHSAWPAVCNPL